MMTRILIIEDDPQLLADLYSPAGGYSRLPEFPGPDYLTDAELIVVEMGADLISIDSHGDLGNIAERSMARALARKKSRQHDTDSMEVESKANQVFFCKKSVGFSKQNRRRRLGYSDRRLLRRLGEWQFLRERVLFFSELGLLCACTIAVILIVGGYYATATQVSVIALGGLAGALLRHLAKSGI
jgi:hypothetical protein